jgi:hypothetical protein
MVPAVIEDDTTARTQQQFVSNLELLDQLDDLWTAFLHQLDKYQSAQVAIQKQLSSGFFALAQANFGKVSGRPYGRDYYDQRAVASIRVRVKQKLTSGDGHHEPEGPEDVEIYDHAEGGIDSALAHDVKKFSVDDSLDSSKVATNMATSGIAGSEAGPNLPGKSSHRSQEEEIPRAQDCNGQSKETGHDSPIGSLHDNEEVVERDPTDPLRSFAGGILIPPLLRKTQGSFATLFRAENKPEVDETECFILQAVMAAKSMRQIETEIRRMRKTIRKAEKDAGMN